jgi:hypothetical protein
MDRIQKIILISIISIAAISWVLSKDQPDMMAAMMNYNALAISLFTISWTIGMAAMMFPAITPMVLLYSRLIKRGNSSGDDDDDTVGKDMASSQYSIFVDVTCAWHIQKGNYANTELNNLNVVALFNSPGNMFTGPKWKAALYIDERATQQQKDLITKIYSGQAGGFFAAASNLIGEMLGVKSVPIDFGIDGKRRWLRVKDSN